MATSTSRLARAVRRELKAVGDPARAPQMQAYAKSAMPYRGVPAPLFYKICRRLFHDVEFASEDAWREEVLGLWRGAKFREERYAAMELSGIRQALEYQTPDAMDVYEEMIVSGAWWDYVDAVASHRVGPILRNFPVPMKRLMRQWSRGDNLWKRRTSIICQLGSKESTDLRLLYDCIEPSLGERDFFLRKAIGWALRQYAWTDAAEVVRYVNEKGGALSPLSKREALKNVRD
jgi:3-methyladenine DNA glycosylase AlkD